MTGSQLSAIRKSLGLTCAEWGRALGYSVYSRTAEISVLRLERQHDKHVPGPIEMLAKIYARNPEWFTPSTP